MTDKKNSAPQGAKEFQKSTSNVNTVGSQPATKHDRILSLFIAGASLNRFDAERYGDHCLNSSIAVFRREGHAFHQEWENVPTRFGKTARVLRYRLLKVAA